MMSMFGRIAVGRWAIGGLLLLTLAWWTRLAAPTAAQDLEEGKIRVLLITGGHGFEHEPFFALFDAMADVQTTRVTYPDAAALLDPQRAKDYDVLVFYDMWSKGITPSQQGAFVKLLDHGIGVVALHHTLASHPSWPEYAKILGGKYYTKDRVVEGKTIPKSGYLHGQEIQVHVADAEHPITRGLKDFTIHDEVYNGYDIDPAVRVLLTTKHPRSDPELAWVKTYGNSRVFYLQLGHGRDAYENPNYRQLVGRAVRWAAGRPADPSAAALPLFNGRDLTGWKPEGHAHWEVQDGVLIGRQGADHAPGDLLSEASFDDFQLRVTFRMEWPGNSGVWYRYQSARQTYQADILEYKEPYALTGTLYCPSKKFIAINDDPQTVRRDGWNTLVVRAVGNRHVVFLNGKKVADVRDDTSRRGRIGFQVHPGAQFAKMRILIKEVTLRPI